MENTQKYGPSVLRLVLGLAFIAPGLMKLMNPGMVIGMLGEMGVPAAAFMGWVLLLSEILFGGAVLAGWKVKYTVWPLALVLTVALFAVWAPMISTNPLAPVVMLLHIVGIGGLVSLALTGPGAIAVDKE